MDTAASLTPDQAQQVIYSFLRTGYNLPDPISKLITAQSGHETAGWTSNVYNTLNNAFGFGYSGGGNYYGYNDIESSVSDVVNWLTAHVPNFQNITDAGVYAQALHDAGYYTDTVSNYENGIINYFNDNLAVVASVSAFLLIGIGVVLFLIFGRK